MIHCTGTPAETCALPYIEGTLPDFELERFEEHYFDCPVCLAHLQALQAAGQALARQPAVSVRDVRSRAVFAWPVSLWALGAAAALLVVGVFTYRAIYTPPVQPDVTQKAPEVAPQTAPQARPANQAPALVNASQLADLALPAFVAPNLRGASEEAHFQAGMKAYAHGDCGGALASLAQVPAEDIDARAAKFYSGACQMHQGNLGAAAASLREVADAGDSPQQESALYYLAQIALAGNDPVAAHKYLLHTIALQGDLEQRARAEDKKVLQLIDRNRVAGARISGSK